MNTKRRYTGPDQELLCTSCRRLLPVTSFALRQDTKIPRVRSNCRECLAARATLKNRENHTDAQVYWWARSIAKYGLTPTSWRKLFESQGNRCAICGIKDNGKKRFHVDHDHDSGEVRGILCTTCNVGVGAFKDNADLVFRAFEYLSLAVPESDPRDYDTPVSVNPSTEVSGNTEETSALGSVETERGALA